MINKSPRDLPNKGGTALPTCVYWGTSILRSLPPVVSLPKKTKESGKDCILAISLTVKPLKNNG